jgi:hypothetical protein
MLQDGGDERFTLETPQLLGTGSRQFLEGDQAVQTSVVRQNDSSLPTATDFVAKGVVLLIDDREVPSVDQSPVLGRLRVGRPLL